MPQKAPNQENPSAFKLWINESVVDQYVQGLKKADRSLKLQELELVQERLAPLELRDRVRLIADALHRVLPRPFPRAVKILKKAVRHSSLKGFALWPATEFVQRHGLDHFEESFQVMEEWTTLFTAEFAVRPFLIQNQKAALQRLLAASKSKNVHLRRWASEGSRPRLPWGERIFDLVRDPRPTLPILEQLKFDPELYVRKSVSNHLNDIAKDHPDLVVKILQKWKKQVPVGYETQFQFILKQSLRTLIKKGHPHALELMGVRHGDPAIQLEKATLEAKSVKIGNSISFRVAVKNASKTTKTYVLDYAIHHLKSNGTHSPKVFKLKSGVIAPQADLQVIKKHSFKQVTTREYYPGPHFLEIWLNGAPQVKLKFELKRL